MAFNQSFTQSPDVWPVAVEWNITAAGAVVPNADNSTTTEPVVGVVRASAGTYTVTIPGNFQKTLFASANYRAAAGTSAQAQVVGISLGGGTPSAGGEATTTVTVTTAVSNATPAAADLATGTVGIDLWFQKHKI